MAEDLRFGPLTSRDVHLCVDMQRLFAEKTDWHTPWMSRITPNVERIARAHPGQTICTRFVPPRRAADTSGTWVRYYERWSSMTRDALGDAMIDLVPALQAIEPPLERLDKPFYSPWVETELEGRLRARGAESVVVTGGETDVCVMATVLGAVDRGYRVVVVVDALCSSADEVHDAAMALYRNRFGQQVETVTTADVLQNWAD